MRNVAVTATRRGLTGGQYGEVHRWLSRLAEWGAGVLHHGDCVGGDIEVARIAVSLGYRTVAHPPSIDVLRGFHRSDEIRDPLPYLERDRVLVDCSDVLIGCPDGVVERRGSGTWYTIGYARKVGCGLLVISPDGQLIDRRRDTRDVSV